MKPLVVECFGLPGAGKTTIVGETLASLRTRGRRVSDNAALRELVGPLRISQKIRLLIRRGRFVSALWEVVRYFFAIQPWSTWKAKQVIKLLLDESYIEYAVNELTGEFLILDQATVQRVWSAAAMSEVHPSACARMLRHLVRQRSANTVFVYFDVSVDEAARRIESRSHGGSRFDRKNKDEIASLLVRELPRMRQFRDVLQAESIPVFQIEAQGSIQERSTQLEHIIVAHLMDQHSHELVRTSGVS